MELILKEKNVSAFMERMAVLEEKFNYKYLTGELYEYVKLDSIDNRVALSFIKPVPEMVRIACTMCFVDTLL